MEFRNSLFIVLASISLTTLAFAEGPVCNTKQSCQANNQDCQCWCSVKCGPRDKKPDDALIWFDEANDPYGKGCYCAQRDLDLFEQNCAGR